VPTAARIGVAVGWQLTDPRMAEGCIYSDRGHDQQVFLRTVRPAPNPGKSPGDVPTPGESVAYRAIVDRPHSPGGPVGHRYSNSLPDQAIPKLGLIGVRSAGEQITLLSFSPDNVHETRVWPGGRSGSPIVAAEAQQVEPTRTKTWSRARSEVFVPYKFSVQTRQLSIAWLLMPT
jgi:hypothetical protein